jgi:hypothetical protein
MTEENFAGHSAYQSVMQVIVHADAEGFACGLNNIAGQRVNCILGSIKPLLLHLLDLSAISLHRRVPTQ